MFSGSIAGGTLITIQGDGFIPGYTYVTIGTTQYINFASINYSTINLITDNDQNGLKSINVLVGTLNAVGSASFMYSSINSPTIDLVSPIIIADSTLMTIFGTNLGYDTSKLNVLVSSQNCNVQSASNTNLTCLIDGISIGANPISVKINGNFSWKFSLQSTTKEIKFTLFFKLIKT